MNSFFKCLLSFLPLFSIAQAQNFSSSTSNLDFGTKLKNTVTQQSFYIRNLNSFPISQVILKSTNKDFVLSDTLINLNANDSIEVIVTFKPRHNINYNSSILIKSANNVGSFAISLAGIGQYPGNYYTNTQNLWDEQLKSSLKTILSTGYQQLGYSNRLVMFSVIDNKRLNGEATSNNQIECVYTGRIIEDYPFNTGTLNNAPYSMNTEHTFPQSYFGSVEPMQSDLFHLFPSDGSANTRRSNDPFGIVQSPVWAVGGSLSDNSFFEPRNEHKGNAARALLYFVVRYQDFANFVAPQETLLRNWALTYPPDRIDSIRNESIFAIQKNRNPFIDHPEFFERIWSICTNANRPNIPLVEISNNEIDFGNIGSLDTQYRTFYIANKALGSFFLNASCPNVNINLVYSNQVSSESYSQILVKWIPNSSNSNLIDTITLFSTNPDVNGVKIPVKGNLNLSLQNLPGAFFNVFPNPTRDILNISHSEHFNKVQIFDLNGKEIISDVLNFTSTEINTINLNQGCYFGVLSGPYGKVNFKFIKL